MSTITTDTTKRSKSYLTQPVGIPEDIPTTLDVDDSYTVFRVVLHAVQTWQPDDQVLPNEAAHRALIDATEALQIMARAQLTAMGPLVQAHRDDDWAAQEWAFDRWLARSQLARSEEEERRNADAAKETLTAQSDAPAAH